MKIKNVKYSEQTYQTLAYAPFGEILVNEFSGDYDEPYKFTGYERDRESGLDYAHARYKDINLGFISTDPMWWKYPNITPYNYCGNNPMRYIDPTGMGPEDNPETPGKNEKYAMKVVDFINWATNNLNNQRNGKIDSKHTIKGNYVELNAGERTDTDLKSAEQYNMFVNMNSVFNVNECDASSFANYETHIVSILMTGFITGTGPENYNFLENGIISSLFLGSDVLNAALAEYNQGKNVSNKQYTFDGVSLAKNIIQNKTPYNLVGLVGSANITITPAENNMLRISIFNITSLTSGAFGKELIPNQSAYPVSYCRDPNKRTPYGNISQTFNLLIPANR